MFSFDFKKSFQTKPKNRIGLDIGSSAVKIVEIENLEGKSILAHIGLKKLPNPSKETLVESIKSLIEESKISSKEVSVSVSGPSTIVRFVSMPKMREDELKGAIKFEAEKYIPFAIDDCIIDYQVLKKDEKENKLDMLLVAVKKELVMGKIAIAEAGGLDVRIVDVDTFAIANSFLKNFNNHDTNKTAALLNIGSGLTNVSIVRDGVLHFSRDVAIGGADFNNVISKGLNLDPAGAENIKIAPKDKAPDVVSCTKSMLNNLLDEMRLSFSYYENQSGMGIDEIYLSGGTSDLVGLEGAFHEAFESKPFLWDPTQFLDTSRVTQNADLIKKMSRSFAVAVGLAIR
ncbi:MAG: type IV pilus assembly protein PilM [Candidatus Omnitrophota bacterium]|nr:type IV pilus assembly protein PilM [Candidatus Omnitrophota bacterium]